ncbi:EAL domain-containing protein [Glaciecola sp. MF2-115]|uniref:two-component system response regulator n=1 Tax=Glaciecola sp. MF2-115 TaxID=3384827 RepID=UPI0039A2F785
MISNLEYQEFTILAVDDASIFLDIIEDAVSHLGKFIRAEDGESALVKAREFRPDIILLDIELPDINGLEVAKRLKSNPATSASSIIFITAHSEFDNELKAFLEGGVDFVSKPINRQLIQARVRTHLSLINKTRQLRKAHDELANFVAKLNIFISYWSHDLINIHNNDVDGKWFNKSSEQIFGQSLLSLFSESEGKAFQESIEQCRKEKKSNFEFSFTSYQKQTKNIQVTLVDEQAFEDQSGFLIIMSEVHAPIAEVDSWELEKHKLTTSLTAVADGVITTDTLGNITYANVAAGQLIGQNPEALLSQPINSVMSLIDRNTNEEIVNPVNYALSERSKVALSPDSLLLSTDGQKYEIEELASPIFDDTNQLIGCVLVFRDVTKKNQDQRKILHLSHHDTLTNLPNRALLLDRTEQAIKEAKRDDHKVAMLMLNIDHFQLVNNKYGYAVGDQVLAKIAGILQTLLRDYDTISRQGGDEFVIILPMISEVKDIGEFCSRMKSEFARKWQDTGYDFNLTMSIGVSSFPNDCDDVHQLFRRAHAAMHEAKRSGRDAVRFFSKEIEAKIKWQQHEIIKLKNAIENEEITLFYQPKVQSDTLEILGFEALARWPQEDGSIIFPDHFIPLAEETGLIVPLGEYLLKQASMQLLEWQKLHPKLKVAVNVSAVQFTIDFVSTVKQVLSETGIEPSSLELEITESVLLNDVNSLETFNELKKLGVKISIDDFGTGYSSLSYIKKYMLDVLKIDQSFVRNMLNDKVDITIIRTIITLAQSLQIDLVAEGVESQEHADQLNKLGCKTLQGYHFGRPISAAETSKKLAISCFI